jgi:hypothetical protein
MGHGQPPDVRRGVESVELSSDGRMPGTARVSRDPGVPRPHDAARGWRSRYYLPDYDEPGALQAITGHRANKLLGGTGAFWHADYFDRAIRDGRHFLAAVEYIENNPVKAGLVPRAQLWPFGSARPRRARPGTPSLGAVPGIRRPSGVP